LRILCVADLAFPVQGCHLRDFFTAIYPAITRLHSQSMTRTGLSRLARSGEKATKEIDNARGIPFCHSIIQELLPDLPGQDISSLQPN
jgi:hypothetical protein